MELEPVVTRLGAWGARSPAQPDSQAIGADSIVLALRSLFDPELAGEMVATFELRLGEDVFHVDVGDWEIGLHRGAAEDADAAIEADPGTLAAVLTGRLPLDEALGSGAVEIEGSRRTVARFLRAFPMPAPCTAGAAGQEAGDRVPVSRVVPLDRR
jgi:putative sterol carrier protein